MKKDNRADLTQQEDLSFAVMNLISLEEHLAMTSAKTKKQEYLVILSAVRKLRTKLMRTLVKNTTGECWCISKHLLSSTMRLMETATKYLNTDIKQAHELEKSALDLYTLFWFIQEMEEKPVVKGKKIEAENA